MGPGPGYQVEAEARVVTDGRPRRRRALPAEHRRCRVGGGGEDGGHVATRPVEMGLDDVQDERRGDGRVERVAARLELGHRRRDASQCVEDTMPNVPRRVGRVVLPVILAPGAQMPAAMSVRWWEPSRRSCATAR